MLTYLLSHTPLLYFVQSLWRDEAFSILVAERSLSFIITKLGFEPPLYYIMLHYWIKIFNTSEIAARSLSVLGFLLATVIVIEWAAILYKKNWLSWYLPLFFFLNPMLLYYAFEVRTYAWYIFFTTLMLFAYINKKWLWFAIAAILGFYTHVYILPYIGMLFLDWIWRHKKNVRSLKTLQNTEGLKAFIVISLALLPWLIHIIRVAINVKGSWYFPVDWHLIKSVLGNMFVGYEGTPWYVWKYTSYLSLVLVGLGTLAFTYRTKKNNTSLFIFFGIVPLVVIIGISFIKPLFVNRYLIPTTIAEVFVVVAALSAISKPLIQKYVAGIFLIAVIWFNWWYTPFHSKSPFREIFSQINLITKPKDIILANNPIIYLETLYYAKDRSRVYLYNPNNGVFPWYIGDALITPSRMIRDYPTYPARAILIKSWSSYEIVYRLPL